MKNTKKADYQKKYQLSPKASRTLGAWMSNPTVQPDGKTEMGVPIPSTENVEYSKEYGEENEL